MSAEKSITEAELPVDRGDEVTQPDPVKVELTDEDLAAIGRAPDKTQAAEPEKKEEVAEAKVEDKAEKKQPITIPKARFDEVNNKARAKVAELTARLEAAEAKLAAAGTPPDVAALETALNTKSTEYGKLIADGDLDQADLVMKEMNKLNRQLVVAETTALTHAHTKESKHMDSLETLVGMYKDAFPVFDDSKPDQYNQDYVDYVAKLQGGFEAANMSPAEALREAVEVAVAKFGLISPDEVKAPEPEKNKGTERKQASIDKALKAAGAQPPSLATVGSDSDKLGMSNINLNDLSMEEFMALPESTVKRLRGDLVSA